MILHIDLDCFFVSAERIGRPELDNIPVAVGGRGDPFIFSKTPYKNKRTILQNSGAFVPSLFSSNEDSSNRSYFVDDDDKIRGIVTTSSYEARDKGVKTAMSIHEALRLCPKLVVIKPNHLLYHTLSHKMAKILSMEIPLIEQYSIDEFFCDVSGWIKDEDVPSFIIYIKQLIKDELSLPCSIGASHAKWIAKLATSYAKPYGTLCVAKNETNTFASELSISKFPGVGKALNNKMYSYH